MPTDSRDVALEERLSSDEIDALRVRLGSGSKKEWDVRAHGATTVQDLSEALQVPSETVQEQLDRWRAEQAILPPKRLPRSQKGLLALGVMLLGGAYGIRLIKESGDGWQQQVAFQVSQFRKSFKPKSVHYPITNKIAQGENSAPYGMPITITGPLTVTKNEPLPNGRPLSADAVTAQLSKALAETVRMAKQYEDSAPVPTKPLTHPFGMIPEPGMVFGQVANSSSNFVIGPTSSDKNPTFDWSPSNFESTARGIVNGVIASQAPHLQPDSSQPFQIVPPAGFQITFKGKRNDSYQANSILILPVDEQLAKQVVLYARDALRRDLLPMRAPVGLQQRMLDEKIPIPSYSIATIRAPLGELKFNIPTGPSKEFPTAAAASRGAEDVLNKIESASLDQIKRLNGGEWKQ